jgi:hypothetical protein
MTKYHILLIVSCYLGCVMWGVLTHRMEAYGVCAGGGLQVFVHTIPSLLVRTAVR